MTDSFKTKVAVWIIGLSTVSSLAIMAGTAYVVFVLGASGWWWLLGLMFVHGECVACYKLVNAFLFDKPLKWT